jgi:drug/metabolite transporter (DMT)-like permease
MVETKKSFSKFIFICLSAALVIGWSSGFVGIRYANESAPVSLILFWRNLVAGMILLPFAIFIGPRITLTAFVHQVVLGIAGMFLYLASFAIAIAYRVPTGLVALIADLVPLAIAALSQPIMGQPLTLKQWMGTAIGVGGVVIVSIDSITLGHAPMLAYFIPVAGMFLFATMTVLQKRLKAIATPIHQSLAIQCLTASCFFVPWAWHDGTILPPADIKFLIGIAWLVVLATYVCYGVYYILLRNYPPARISSVVYLSPPMTMIWGWAMFNEPLSVNMAIGTAITFAGVIFASSQH